MHIPTIDREEAIIHFRQLLELESPLRILRLVGAPKMGKTHLLTKVFRRIAEQQAAHCTVIDLRNPQQTITTHLHNTCSQIGYCHFPTFDRAYTEWLNRPQIQITGLRAIFANFSVRASSESFNTDHVIPHLTRCFVSDLQKLNARIVVLIFDQMDNVAPETQAWLMEV